MGDNEIQTPRKTGKTGSSDGKMRRKRAGKKKVTVASATPSWGGGGGEMHSGRDIYCMNVLRCSSVATNVCMRRDLNSRWRDMAHWPPESGALAHGLTYESKIIPKKNRHSESVPQLCVCVV